MLRILTKNIDGFFLSVGNLMLTVTDEVIAQYLRIENYFYRNSVLIGTSLSKVLVDISKILLMSFRFSPSWSDGFPQITLKDSLFY